MQNIQGDTDMISDGRYRYHLYDIAEIEAMPKPLNPVHQMNLDRMKKEVAEYEKAHNIQLEIKPESAPKPKHKTSLDDILELLTVNSGTACEHGNIGYCGLCESKNKPRCSHGNIGYCGHCAAEKRR